MGKDFRDGFRSYVRTEVPANNRKGRRVVYVYHGQMYHFAMTAHAFRALKAELFVLSLIWAAVQVGVLCLPVPSNGTNLVTIPAFLALAAAAYVVYNALSFLTTKQDAPAWEYHAVNRRFILAASCFWCAFLCRWSLWLWAAIFCAARWHFGCAANGGRCR